MMFVNSRPFLGTREQTRDVITSDKPTKRAAVKERHKIVVAGALMLQLPCRNVTSSHDERRSQQEGSVIAFGLHIVLLLVGIPGLNKGQVTDGYGCTASFRTGSAFYFLHLPT